jgi:hypothetical protein
LGGGGRRELQASLGLEKERETLPQNEEKNEKSKISKIQELKNVL